MAGDLNVAMVEKVAVHLGDLKPRVVFLGGAATGLLLTDPGAPPIRATKDVDVIVQIGSRLEYRSLEKELLALGFKQDRSEGAPLCRWMIDGLLLDVMPTDPSLLGFSNRWYPEAMKASVPHFCPVEPKFDWYRPRTFSRPNWRPSWGAGRGISWEATIWKTWYPSSMVGSVWWMKCWPPIRNSGPTSPGPSADCFETTASSVRSRAICLQTGPARRGSRP